MRRKNKKGFSLAELMIALLVISVALAATAPTITKSILGSDTMWKTSVNNNVTGGGQAIDVNTIFFNGPNVLIGTQRLPNFKRASRYFPDAISTRNFDFSPKTDKLVIMGNLADGDSFASSHISFYNQVLTGAQQSEYVGRLASDRYNLALGIGSLQSLVPNLTTTDDNAKGIHNTAIGHYALFRNQHGSFNTALGYKALQGTTNSSPYNNIALGDHALQHVEGNNNIAIGSFAGRHLEGSNNIVIGVGAGYGLTGSNNLLITPITGLVKMDNLSVGDSIQGALEGNRGNTKYPYITDSDNFSIGVIDFELFSDSANRSAYVPPVIQGFTRTQTCTGTDQCVDGIRHAKGIIINTDKFNMRQNPTVTQVTEANANNRIPEGKRIFSVHAKPGSYEEKPIDISTTDKTELKKLPCEGSIFCLTKFFVTTASYYSTQTAEGLYKKNVYYRTHSFPDFKGKIGGKYSDSTRLAHESDNTVYDLYIGTDINNPDITNDKKVTLEDINTNENGTELDSIDKKFTEYFNRKNYIDVGKEANSDGLVNSRWTNAINLGYPVSSRPDMLDGDDGVHSLNIRTVKTAVNFIEEFKETSSNLDRFRDVMKYNINCIFKYKDENFSSCQSSFDLSNGTCPLWDRIKKKDCSIICPDGDYSKCGEGISGGLIEATITGLKQIALTGCYALGGKQETTCSGSADKLVSCPSMYPKPEEEKTEESTEETTPSDARLKNISGDNTAGIKEINKLNVVNYTYKADKAKTPHVGVIAQELKTVFPDAVKKGSDGYYRIRLEDMFYAMINSVQQLSDRKDDLNNLTVDYIDTPLSELQKQNADIKAQNELLKQKNAEMEKRLSKLETK